MRTWLVPRLELLDVDGPALACAVAIAALIGFGLGGLTEAAATAFVFGAIYLGWLLLLGPELRARSRRVRLIVIGALGAASVALPYI